MLEVILLEKLNINFRRRYGDPGIPLLVYPCIFCKSKKIYVATYEDPDEWRIFQASIACPECGYRGPRVDGWSNPDVFIRELETKHNQIYEKIYGEDN